MKPLAALACLPVLDVAVTHALRLGLTRVPVPELQLPLWSLWVTGVLRAAVLSLVFCHTVRRAPQCPAWLLSRDALQSVLLLSLLLPCYATLQAVSAGGAPELLWGWHCPSALALGDGVTVATAVLWQRYAPSPSEPGSQKRNGASLRRLAEQMSPDARHFTAVGFFLVVSSLADMAIPYYTGRMTDWIMNEEEPEAFNNAITAMALITSGSAVSLFQLSSLALKVSILYYGGMLVTSGDMSSGDLVSFILYELQFSSAVEVLFSYYPHVKKAIGASEKIFEYMDREPEMTAGTLAPETLRGRVEFKNVSFAYPRRPDTTVLKSVSFELRPGEITALVGPSGGGKSTCVCLLERFYQPQSGEILLDGAPLQDYQHSYLHRKVALVSQEPMLFARSVQENISYGVEQKSKEEVQRAAKRAIAHDFITELQEGYSTVLVIEMREGVQACSVLVIEMREGVQACSVLVIEMREGVQACSVLVIEMREGVQACSVLVIEMREGVQACSVLVIEMREGVQACSVLVIEMREGVQACSVLVIEMREGVQACSVLVIEMREGVQACSVLVIEMREGVQACSVLVIEMREGVQACSVLVIEMREGVQACSVLVIEMREGVQACSVLVIEMREGVQACSVLVIEMREGVQACSVLVIEMREGMLVRRAGSSRGVRSSVWRSLRDPRILILDDATSSLDTETEHLVQSAVLNGRRCSVLLISHRLSSLERADRIIVLQGGEVVEQGSHSDLLQRGGVYQSLLEKQSRSFDRNGVDRDQEGPEQQD
ncbi:UNVERIFIED_CONTAM: hypothetical protein FKN15_055306 [Acipenser sinensis]